MHPVRGSWVRNLIINYPIFLLYTLRLTFSYHFFLLQDMTKESIANLNHDIARLRMQVNRSIHQSNLVDLFNLNCSFISGWQCIYFLFFIFLFSLCTYVTEVNSSLFNYLIGWRNQVFTVRLFTVPHSTNKT